MRIHLSNDKLSDLIMESGLVTANEFAQAHDEAERLNESLIDVLISHGKLTEDYFVELLSPKIHIPSIDLERVEIDSKDLEQLPETFARANNVVIFEFDKKKQVVKLAMLDPLDYETIEYVRAKLGVWVEPYVTTSESLRYALRNYKREIAEDFNKIISQNVKRLLVAKGESDLTKLAEAVPIITILNSVMDHAISLNASDIHFEPLEKIVLVRFRIDGILHEMLSLHLSILPILVARVKVLAALKIDEHLAPQDGRFRYGEESEPIDVRVNVMPTMRGEKVEMRLLHSTIRAMTLTELGMADATREIVERSIKKPHGMILVTGPTGHGKTTTLYAILNILNTPEVNIVTIEDPIEYEIERVNQTQVNPKAGITFANGLRSLLRQNPDIVMVGEIRDEETADIAVHSALTGHLVLSTLHTNDAPSALPRFVDMGVEPFLLVSTLNIVIAQRLVRRICATCVASFPVTEELQRLMSAQIELLGEGHTGAELPHTVYRGRGCNVCSHTGFRGQVGIFEVMHLTEAIRKLVLDSTPVFEIRKQAIKDGMGTMFEDGLKKVQQGVTTIEEILRVVRE